MSDEHKEQEIDPMDEHLKTLEQFKGDATTQNAVLLQRYKREAEAIRSMPSPARQDRDRLDWLFSEIAVFEVKT
jgi:hypothetical protein